MLVSDQTNILCPLHPQRKDFSLRHGYETKWTQNWQFKGLTLWRLTTPIVVVPHR